MSKRIRALVILLATAAVAVGIGVGAAMGVSDGEAPEYGFDVLNQPPAGATAPLPEEVEGTPFADLHSNVDLEQRRLARVDGGVSTFVAPGRPSGEICVLTAAADGSAASTCNPPSILKQYGSIPLLLFNPDGSAIVFALVPDGVRAVASDDGSAGDVQGNVARIRVGSGATTVAFLGGAEGTRLDIGLWREGD